MIARACRVCGCTDDRACVWFEVLGDGRTFKHRCSWVAPDLCSECGAAAGGAVGDVAGDLDAPPLLYDAHGGVLVR